MSLLLRVQVEKRIQEERARVRTYLNIVSGPKLRSIVESILIEDKAEALVNVRPSAQIW